MALQSQVDILSSARLVTPEGGDTAPFAAHNDSLKQPGLGMRDDLAAPGTSGLKPELERLREELAATTSETGCSPPGLRTPPGGKEARRTGGNCKRLRKQSGACRHRTASHLHSLVAGLTVIEETLPPQRPVPAPRAQWHSVDAQGHWPRKPPPPSALLFPPTKEFESIGKALAPMHTVLDQSRPRSPENANALAPAHLLFASGLHGIDGPLGRTIPSSRLTHGGSKACFRIWRAGTEPLEAPPIRTLTHATDLDRPPPRAVPA